jgi:hypothetical protein
MSINALKAGVDSWDRDLNRYIDSDLILLYNPLEDYLQHLAPWDKKDRIGELARRVKTDNPHWVEDFHKWMLSMVAQWTGKDQKHGNAIVPLLIAFNNSTHLWPLKGHTPSELFAKSGMGQVIPFAEVRRQKAGRNDPCPCGSGLRYCRCHGKYLS